MRARQPPSGRFARFPTVLEASISSQENLLRMNEHMSAEIVTDHPVINVENICVYCGSGLGTDPRYAAARMWVDEIIDPRDTRRIIARSIEAAAHQPEIADFKVGVLQT